MIDNHFIIFMSATYNLAYPIVDHCQYCRSKKLRINLSFKTLRYSSKASLPTAFAFVQ